jgi:phenylacetic acid degradation operon negative regulatory protein
MAKDRNACRVNSVDEGETVTAPEPLLERPLAARSAIASLLLGMHPPRMPAARLVRWCGVFGIAEGTARVALHRMVERGELVVTDGRYELAGPVRARQEAQDWSLTPESEQWDGEWRFGLVRAAARDASDRAALREAFRRLRYAAVREGCWVRPDNLPRASGRVSEWAVVDAQCDWWRAAPDEDPVDLAAHLFAPAEWARRANRLRRRLDDVTGGLEHASARDDVLASAFEAGAAVLAHVRADPLLPESLCPPAWPGGDLRTAYTRYQQAFGSAVQAWFRA